MRYEEVRRLKILRNADRFVCEHRIGMITLGDERGD